MNIVKYAVIAASAFAGIAMASTTASALPMVSHSSGLAATAAEDVRVVCNRFGRCFRTGGPRFRGGYGRGYRGGYGRGYRRGYYR